MAIFSQTPRTGRGGPTSKPMDERRRGEGGLSIIGAGMTIIGDVETDGVVKVEGRVKDPCGHPSRFSLHRVERWKETWRPRKPSSVER